jgi:hydrogenase/urease accessory protein HupE
MMRAARLALLWLAAACGLTQAAFAHEIRPAYLQIREIEPGTYDLLWKTPAQGDMRLALNVVLPGACVDAAEPRSTMVDGAVIQRWRTTCAGGIVGKQVGIENLSQTLTDAIVRFEPLEGSAKTLRVTPDDPAFVIPDRQAWTEVAGAYFGLGVEHTLFGFDHLMFVLALLILVSNFKRLLAAVTAFTVAHSLTLAGTTLGWVSLPSAPVEATIALSIMFVAVEIMRARAGRQSLTAMMPWLASFSFGLLHGFGFAGALREVGIPGDAVGVALLFFNLGVEAGQLIFIAAVLAFVFIWKRVKAPAPQWAWQAPVYFIGICSAYWFVERTWGVFTG